MSHRKIDVDAYDEDEFVEEDAQLQASLPSSAEVDGTVNARAGDVRNLLARGDIAGAVTKALEDPPEGRDVQAAKDRNTQTVMDSLLAAKSSDIPNIVSRLNPQQLDTLMKYIYRGMANPELYNAAVLLSWHEKAYEAGGLGCIIRVMTDRKTA
ncbi:hypothetical protein SeMB42_g00784 [Synchytrium endobioticum]|uniref:Actin-related protein 2/3 complex subunit 5 n=1 Tax=Synchytrium endobioticum TaxID=286115 RepID=A0A507DKP2_9FUNG|nr:hypothetical protein SeLEV6574_g00293 [Synchytrium endobioticum]TPX53430.1 hypothetical protein SeMB42_g00784 [Synchytrium endobioticum]